MKEQIIAAVIVIVSLVFFFTVNSSYAQKELADPLGAAALNSAAAAANRTRSGERHDHEGTGTAGA